MPQVDAAEAKNQAVVIVNPVLQDIPSHSGIMGVRGRAERLSFVQSFVPGYHLRLLYYKGQDYPIIGCLRYSYGGKWQVQHRQFVIASSMRFESFGRGLRLGQPITGSTCASWLCAPSQATCNS